MLVCLRAVWGRAGGCVGPARGVSGWGREPVFAAPWTSRAVRAWACCRVGVAGIGVNVGVGRLGMA